MTSIDFGHHHRSGPSGPRRRLRKPHRTWRKPRGWRRPREAREEQRGEERGLTRRRRRRSRTTRRSSRGTRQPRRLTWSRLPDTGEELMSVLRLARTNRETMTVGPAHAISGYPRLMTGDARGDNRQAACLACALAAPADLGSLPAAPHCHTTRQRGAGRFTFHTHSAPGSVCARLRFCDIPPVTGQ